MKIGLEVEGWGSANLGAYAHGQIVLDAAPDMVELVTYPHDEASALAAICALAEQAPDLTYNCRRTASMPAGEWRPDLRYHVVLTALAKDCPDTWEGVHGMVNHAATQMNYGISWRTQPGVTLLSLLNNLGPKIASELQGRHQIDCCRHLALWHGWADQRRLPSPEHWWDTYPDLERHYSSTPRLIKQGRPELNEPTFLVDLALFSGDIYSRLQQGTTWFLARPKTNPEDEDYIETRLFGSMDPCTAAFADVYGTFNQLVRDIVTVVADSSCERADAPDVLSDLRRSGHDYLPERLLDWDDWAQCPAWGIKRA